MDMNDFFQKISANLPGDENSKKINQIWTDFMRQLMENPSLWMETMQTGRQKQAEILSTLQSAPAIAPPKGDRRFTSDQWRSNPLFSMLMQSYLLNSDMLRTMADRADMPEQDRKILKFAINQYIDAMAPTNFPATNPDVMDEAIKTGGESLAAGMRNMMEDLQSGRMVKNTDLAAFTIGENIATSAGRVVHQTPLMQLIEYSPQTPQIHARPLLIVPPCINKYYILDLTPEKSMVAHLVAAGHRVFLVSWANADHSLNQIRWDDYLRDGVMAAIEATRSIGKHKDINAMGFCIGGTLLVAALAALAANDEHPVKTVTLLAAMLDFSDTGEIGLFIDESTVAAREKRYAQAQGGGIMDGRELARGFATLRPNDLIWPYVIGNYYQGKQPPAFDLLYWNADSTNLPGGMFADYLRMTYLENQIANGTAVMCGESIDPAKLRAAVYGVACEKDHIVPWQTAYSSLKLFAGKHRFILAASGHIAGIINPPANNKGWYAAADTTAADAAQWQNGAAKRDGSWWRDWFAFLAKNGGKKIPAPGRAGNVRYPPTEAAPGTYVTMPRPRVEEDESPAAPAA